MKLDSTFVKEQFVAYVKRVYRPTRAAGRVFAQGIFADMSRAMTVAVAEAAAVATARATMIRIARVGVPVPVYVVQANARLWQPGDGPPLPALVLMTFDREKMNDRLFMVGLVRKLQSLKNTEQTDPDLKYAATIVTNEMAEDDRRRLLPESMTGGVTVFAADLRVQRHRLKEGYLEDTELLCLAEPGFAGRIELVPQWIAAGHKAGAPFGYTRTLTSRSGAAAATLVGTAVLAAVCTGAVVPAPQFLRNGASWSVPWLSIDDSDTNDGGPTSSPSTPVAARPMPSPRSFEPPPASRSAPVVPGGNLASSAPVVPGGNLSSPAPVVPGGNIINEPPTVAPYRFVGGPYYGRGPIVLGRPYIPSPYRNTPFPFNPYRVHGAFGRPDGEPPAGFPVSVPGQGPPTTFGPSQPAVDPNQPTGQGQQPPTQPGVDQGAAGSGQPPVTPVDGSQSGPSVPSAGQPPPADGGQQGMSGSAGAGGTDSGSDQGGTGQQQAPPPDQPQQSGTGQ